MDIRPGPSAKHVLMFQDHSATQNNMMWQEDIRFNYHLGLTIRNYEQRGILLLEFEVLPFVPNG